ncbi:MAG: glycosyltransferase family 4 protein [Bryobacterales bacterium]|nr:glycosyltransferase family 4 protein [Bryobacterales bacterium]
MKIALDATYSLGEHLSGVGLYSREMLFGLARARPEQRFRFCYRPHRWLRSFSDALPSNCRRTLLQEPFGPRRPDVFHGLNQRLPRLPLRRAVTTFHDLFVLTGDYSSPEFRRRFAEQARDAAARSDHIITVSAFTARQVGALLGVEAGRITVIHHGVRKPERTVPGVRGNLILHVGAIQRRKNIVRLVEAFEKVSPEWELALAGSAGFGAEEILSRIEQSPCRRRIRVLGYLSAQALEELYARAKVLAFPSLDEGFGMPVLEAMARGVAVLTSDRSALPEVAGDAALRVDPCDTDAIADGLLRITRDEDLRAGLVRSGLEHARNFTWEQAVERTWEVYRRLAG